MKKPTAKKVNIFLSLEKDIFSGYFNAQDPAPLYKRQLSHDFEEYIMTSIRAAKRESQFHYKISFTDEKDKSFAEPLVYAIRQHFTEKKAQVLSEFEKFKRRAYKLLFISLSIVMLSHGLLPLLLPEENIPSGVTNSMDVLCWVITWKPIERLIFYWNPYLKDISVIDRLEKGEAVLHEVNS